MFYRPATQGPHVRPVPGLGGLLRPHVVGLEEDLVTVLVAGRELQPEHPELLVGATRHPQGRWNNKVSEMDLLGRFSGRVMQTSS